MEEKDDEQICIYKFAHKMPICVYRQEINGTFYCFNNCKGCIHSKTESPKKIEYPTTD